LSNPFDTLKSPGTESKNYDEWGGQFDCSTRGCYGWANVAKYFPKLRVLAWECQHGHISKLENVDE
jgi:hypothetical protein